MKPILLLLIAGILFISSNIYAQINQEYKINNESTKLEECEDFDDLTVGGYVAEQLGENWTTWSSTPGSDEDAIITDEQSNSPNNSFVVIDGVYLVFKLNDFSINEGQWLYSHYMFIPDEHSSSFIIQPEPAPGYESVIGIYLNSDGTGTVFQNNTTISFDYPQQTWIRIELNFDYNSGYGVFKIDGNDICLWQNNESIGNVLYEGWNNSDTTGTYYDNVCFDLGWEIEPLPFPPPTNLTGPGMCPANGEVELTWDPPNYDYKKSTNYELLGYNIYRRFNTGQFNLMGFTSELFYLDLIPVPAVYTYYIKAIYDEGESEPSNEWIVEVFVKESETQSKSIQIFPNPASNFVNISFPSIINSLEVFNYNGKKVLEERVNKNSCRLNISHLNTGEYIIKILTNKETLVKSVVIE